MHAAASVDMVCGRRQGSKKNANKSLTPHAGEQHHRHDGKEEGRAIPRGTLIYPYVPVFAYPSD